MHCFKLIDGSLQTVTDPTEEVEGVHESVEAAIYGAGYSIRVANSQLDDGNGPQIAIYQTEREDIPLCYWARSTGSNLRRRRKRSGRIERSLSRLTNSRIKPLALFQAALPSCGTARRLSDSRCAESLASHSRRSLS